MERKKKGKNAATKYLQENTTLDKKRRWYKIYYFQVNLYFINLKSQSIFILDSKKIK